MVSFRRIILLFLFFPVVITANGGEKKKQDAGLWVNFSVTPKPIAQRLFVTYSLEYRSKENFRTTSLWCGAVNVYYNLNSWFKAGAGYEHFLTKDADGRYTPEYRYYPAVLFSFRKGSFAGSLRSYMMNTFTQWNDPHWEWRNKLKMSYQLREIKLKPFVAVEPYHAIYPGDDYLFKKVRYFAGFSYSFGRHTLDSYYLRESFYNKPFINNIIGVEYNIAF